MNMKFLFVGNMIHITSFTKFKKLNIEMSCFELSYEWCKFTILYELPYYVMKEYSHKFTQSVFLIPDFNQDIFEKFLYQKNSKSNMWKIFHFIWWEYLNIRFCRLWSSNMGNCNKFTTYWNRSIRILCWNEPTIFIISIL